MLTEEKILEEFKKWSLDNGILGWTKPNTTHEKEKVKIELVNGNTSQRVLTYRGNTTTIYAVYPSLCSAPVCWAGRVDSCLSRYPHAIAFVGVTIEEAANEFKKWIDVGEFTNKCTANPLFEEVAKSLASDPNPDKLLFPFIYALCKGFGLGDKSC